MMHCYVIVRAKEKKNIFKRALSLTTASERERDAAF